MWFDAPAMNETHPHPSAPYRKAYLGIDNGFKGAASCLTDDNRIYCRPVRVLDLGEERFLDVDGNRELIRDLLVAAGVTRDQILAVFENAQPNPEFGAHNNFTNGRNREFWRLILTLEQIPFIWVTPRRWQDHVFAGMPGYRSKKKNTKAMAAMLRKQLFPQFDTSGYNQEEREGLNDAILIAVWARENRK